MKLLQPLLEHLSSFKSNEARKPVSARKDEIFDGIVDIAVNLHNLYGEEVYKCYSRDGLHPGPPPPNTETPFSQADYDLEDKFYTKSLELFCDFLHRQPYGESVNTKQAHKCIDAFTTLVDGSMIYQSFIIMKICRDCKVPGDKSKQLKKAIQYVINELYKKQKFFPKRKSLPKAPAVNERGEDYASDFSD